MKYIKEYKEIDFDDFDIEENDNEFKVGDYVKPISGYLISKNKYNVPRYSSGMKFIDFMYVTSILPTKRKVTKISGDYFKHNKSQYYYNMSDWKKI